MAKTSLFLNTALFLSLSLPIALVSPSYAQDSGYPAGAYGNAATGLETRLSAVEDQLRALTGKVEQIDYLSRRMEQALQRMQGDYDARLMKLETAPPPPTVVQAPQPAVSSESGAQTATSDEVGESTEQPPVTGTLGGMKVQGDKITGAVVNPKAPPLPNKPADYGLTPQEHYDMAFGLLRQANYGEAEKAFKKFIEKNGNDKLIDNAKYWYGETFYVRGKFGDAAIAFADAYQQNPKGTKAPDALLKLAMSLGSLDKKQDACDALSALKAKYPNAAATIRSRAEQERSRMKCK